MDKEFCERLEYAISGALTESTEVDHRRCWCDGVLQPEDEAASSPKNVAKTNEIVTKAWIDEGRIKGRQRGQFLYVLHIRLGKASLERYLAGAGLAVCIREAGADEWVFLDRERRRIEVWLG